MNKNHPLDKVFRGKLRDFEAEAPMHLWEQVNQKRDLKHRLINQMKHRKPMVALAGAMIISGLAWLLFVSHEVKLDSFPLPLTSSDSMLASEERPLNTTETPYNSDLTLHSKHKEKEEINTIAGTTVISQTNAGLQDVNTQIEFANLPEQVSFVPSPSSALLADDIPSAYPQTTSNTTLASVEQEIATVSPIKERAPEKLLSPAQKYEQQNQQVSLQPDLTSKVLGASPQCVDFSKHNWTFYVDALVSPDYVFRNIQANRPEMEAYAKSRSETEKYQFAFSGALRLSMVADNGLAFRTGVNYSQINEKFTYFNGTEVTTTTTNIYDDQGAIIGVDTLVEIGTRYKVTHNRYTMLDIPLLVGYEFSTRKLNISVNGGAYLNLLFRQQGDLLSPDGLQPIDVENETVFKQQAGIGWYGSVGLAYEIASGLELIAEPHLKVYPSSLTQDQFGVQQRNSSAGLFLGLRKRL